MYGFWKFFLEKRIKKIWYSGSKKKFLIYECTLLICCYTFIVYSYIIDSKRDVSYITKLYIFSQFHYRILAKQNEKASRNQLLSVLKVLRICRVLRPLRAINRAKGLKVLIFFIKFFFKSLLSFQSNQNWIILKLI